MQTISSSETITQIFNAGQRYSTSEVRIIVSNVQDQRDLHGRVAFIAGKKLGNAVFRNRSKRVLRAAAQQLGLPVEGHDIVVMATGRTAEAGSLEVAKGLGRLLKRAGLR